MRKGIFKQTGMSLASLLIGLAIGSFLITSIMQVFTTSKQVASLTSNLGQVNQEGRFLLFHLDKLLSQAGYRASAVYTTLEESFGGTHVEFVDNEFVFKLFTGMPLTVVNCAGDPISQTLPYKFRLKFENNSLLCANNDEENWVTLVDGTLEKFNLYAQLADPRFESFRLKKLQDLEGDDVYHINAIKVSALISSSGDVRLTDDNKQYHNLAGDSSWKGNGDKKLRHVVEFTVLTPHIYEDRNTHIYDILDMSNPEDPSSFSFQSENLGEVGVVYEPEDPEPSKPVDPVDSVPPPPDPSTGILECHDKPTYDSAPNNAYYYRTCMLDGEIYMTCDISYLKRDWWGLGPYNKYYQTFYSCKDPQGKYLVESQTGDEYFTGYKFWPGSVPPTYQDAYNFMFHYMHSEDNDDYDGLLYETCTGDKKNSKGHRCTQYYVDYYCDFFHKHYGRHESKYGSNGGTHPDYRFKEYKCYRYDDSWYSHKDKEKFRKDNGQERIYNTTYDEQGNILTQEKLDDW